MNLREYVLLFLFNRLSPKDFERVGLGPSSNEELPLYLDADQPPGSQRPPLLVFIRSKFWGAVEATLWKSVDELKASLIRLAKAGKLGDQKPREGNVQLTLGISLLQELGTVWAKKYKPTTFEEMHPLQIWQSPVAVAAAHQAKDRIATFGWTNDAEGILWLVTNPGEAMENWKLVDPLEWAKAVITHEPTADLAPVIPSSGYMPEKERHEFLTRLSWKEEAMKKAMDFLTLVGGSLLQQSIPSAASAEDLATKTLASLIEYFAGVYYTPEVLASAAPTPFNQALAQAIIGRRKPKIQPLIRAKF